MAARSGASLLLESELRASSRPASVKEFAAEVTKWRRRAVVFWSSVFFTGGALLALFIIPEISLWPVACLLAVLLAQASVAWLHCFVADVCVLAPTSLLTVKRSLSWLLLWVATVTVFVACCSAFSSGLGQEAPGLALFTPCKETRALDLSVRTVYCLHEPALVQYLAAAGLAAVLVWQHWQRRAYLLAFPALQQRRWFRVKASVSRVTRAAVTQVLWAVFVFYAAYFLWGTWVSAWAASLTSSLLQRPVYVYPALWTESSGYFPLVSLLAISGLVSTYSWHFSAQLARVTFTQRLSFDPNSVGNNQLLVAALREKSNPYVQHLAFLDLCSFSEIDKERRMLMFNDVGEHPALAATLKECCAVLDQFTIDLQAATLAAMERAQKKRTAIQAALENFQQFSSPSKSPGAQFDRRQLVEWAALSMANLVAQSLREDQYGLVQSDKSIPNALNSLVSCLVTVKQHEQATEQPLTARGLDSPPSRPAGTAETLTSAVYRITSTFQRYLQEYEFPEVLVPSLQAFVSFQI